MHADPTAGGNATPDTAYGSARALPTLAEVERSVIEYRLGLFRGNKTAVARSCGVSRETIYTRLDEYKAADRERVNVG